MFLLSLIQLLTNKTLVEVNEYLTQKTIE